MVPPTRPGVLEPGGRPDFILMNSQADVRHALPAIGCPTLVIHRAGDMDSQVDEGRYIAVRIPGARFVELAGDDHAMGADGRDPGPHRGVPDRLPSGASERPRPRHGPLHGHRGLDRSRAPTRRRSLGRAARTPQRSRATQITRFSGEEIDTTGDGFLALFDGPARAIRCALAIRMPCGRWDSRSALASIRGRWSARAAASHAASRCTSAPASLPSRARARCLSPRRRATWSLGQGSCSRTEASMSSKASTNGGASTRLFEAEGEASLAHDARVRQ